MRKIRESDIPGLGVSYGMSTVVNVDVLSDDGATAKIRVQDCGVAASWGQEHVVPSSAVREWWEEA
jgi:hypothetical protein